VKCSRRIASQSPWQAVSEIKDRAIIVLIIALRTYESLLEFLVMTPNNMRLVTSVDIKASEESVAFDFISSRSAKYFVKLLSIRYVSDV